MSKLKGVRKQGSGYMARCPAHEDKHASLSLNEGDDGKCLIYCHAGCAPAAVLAAMGLELKDLYPRASPPTQRIDKVYPYTDTHGRTLFEVVRYVPKAFRQRVPKPGGGYCWSVKGVSLVLYRLPDIISAINSDVPILIVEGEKDVHALAGIWTSATCNPGGAGKWRDSYSKSLTGARVVILPDNDEPGKAHARMVARSLRGYAKSLRVLELPNLPEKGDVSDWIAAGGTRDQLMELAASAACNQNVRADASVACSRSNRTSVFDGFPLTDLGNAERLIAAHGSKLRYNEDSGRWLVWNGKYWQPDNTGEVDRLARDVVRGMADEIKALCDRLKDARSDDERDALHSRIDDLQKHMHNSESRYKLDAMIKLACHCPGVPVLSDQLDSDPWLLNCANGTIDLRTGTLRQHAQSDLITKMVALDYDPEASCPRWEQFLTEVFQNDGELAAFAKRMAGYALTGDTREECLFILTGKGQNGKSKFVETLRAILGEYARDTPITTFTERREANSFDLPALAGARLVTAAEGEGSHAFNES
ncbi:MAG: phage/plasmid primase, P4 family [Armatimonadetes bacterium]|nr:phage/plasmid primase, P4 family [Armatimonadota bacterium]